MSTHKLEIETGRHAKIDRGSRTCVVCKKGEIETEEHHLFYCQLYNEERKVLMQKYDKGRGRDLNMEILKSIFEKAEIKELEILGKYIHTCSEKRSVCKTIQGIIKRVETEEK